MKFEVSHRTTYSYRQPVARSYHVVHLQPRRTARQLPVHHGLLIEPAPVSRTLITDYFGNEALLLRIEDQHSELIMHARSTVEVTGLARVDLLATSSWEEVASLACDDNGERDLSVLQFTAASRHAPITRALRDFARASFPQGRPVLDGVMDLTNRIYTEFQFDATATDISTPVHRVLQMRRGVCQDFAHLAISGLRALGLPTRYVSGYLLTHPRPGEEKLRGTDASHAWISVWAPETGWVDFDPTNGVIPSTEHITVAWGRDYEDISPISGVLLGGGEQVMTVAVDVDLV